LIEQKLTRYLIQDFYCPKTHSLAIQKTSAVSSICSLPLMMDISPDIFNQQLTILLQVAYMHQFVELERIIRELLQ
jgi:hypothetical protein